MPGPGPGPSYEIVGHKLCPYVQRVVIVMLETGLAFERVDIDLDAKPRWLDEISPTGQVPVVKVGRDAWLFESDVIARYLDGVSGGGLLPTDRVERARQEAWMRYGDAMLSIVARIIYHDADLPALRRSAAALNARLAVVAERFAPQPYFGGAGFGLSDAVFATLFRFFPVLDQASGGRFAAAPEPLSAWWGRVRTRPSLVDAVARDYEAALTRFIAAKDSYAGRMLRRTRP